jgi:hypothetical protein
LYIGEMNFELEPAFVIAVVVVLVALWFWFV